MKKFLLLRNNKQSGPYSAEELQQIGLKSYDLIWLQGKSAAWRYPGEIEELKSFAPAVVEQPYDRFYKKSAESKALEKSKEIFVATDNSNASKNTNINNPKPPATTDTNPPLHKHVFVTLPLSSLPQKNDSIKEHELSLEKTVFDDKNTSSEKNEFSSNHSLKSENHYPTHTFRKVLLDAKYSFFNMVFGAIMLVGFGIFIGVVIQNKNVIVDKPEPLYKGKRSNNSTNKNFSSAAAQNSDLQSRSLKTKESELIIDSEYAIKNQPIQISENKIINPIVGVQTESSQKDAQIKLQRNDEVRDMLKPQDDTRLSNIKIEKPPHINLEKSISISNNDFQVGTFGGISKLKLTLKNDSRYHLDLTVVEVQYIKANGDIFKTENIYFKDIDPGKSLTLSAPKSNRGNKVKYKIKLINSEGQFVYNHAEH